MTDPIRAKIIELVPDAKGRSYCTIGPRGGFGYSTIDSPITFADVLRAINIQFSGENGRVPYRLENDPLEFQYMRFHSEYARFHHQRFWNLALDFDNQDQPTKDFIGKLIGV